ncbi:MAG: hypothetical protein ILO10_03125 [Kiritimatiellae bacterium]|nr:hypothetical protein [Kiritimatiellia bacterium]
MKIRIKKPMRCQCPHCGVILETNDPIEGMRVDCPKCGGEFVATPIKTAPRAFTAGKTASTAKPKRKKRRWLKNAMVIVCLLACIGIRYAERDAEHQRKLRAIEAQKAKERDAMVDALLSLAGGAASMFADAAVKSLTQPDDEVVHFSYFEWWEEWWE